MFPRAAPDADAGPDDISAIARRHGQAAVEVLINKPGPCDLRYEGQPMELKEAKPLPSSD